MDTEIDRVARLFPARQQGDNPDPGYLRFLAGALGVDNSLPTKWKRRYAGRIPPAYRARVLAAADQYGVSREALAAIWNETPDRCPTCGQIIQPGTVHG